MYVNTPLNESETILLWHLPVMLAALAMLYVLGPWLVARSCRKRGLPVPSLANRCGQTLLLSILTFIGVNIVAAVASSCLNHFSSKAGPSSDVWQDLIMPAVVLLALAVGVWAILHKHPRNLKLAYGLNHIIAVLAILQCFLSWGLLMRRASLRAVDTRSVSAIGKSLMMYSLDSDTYPQDLRTLVDTANLPATCLVALYGSPECTTRPCTGPCDFKYIPQAASHSDLIWVWEQPEFTQGQGGAVLYGDGRACWLHLDKLLAEVQRTEQWIAAHPATQPASAPTSQPATQPATNPSPTTAAGN